MSRASTRAAEARLARCVRRRPASSSPPHQVGRNASDLAATLTSPLTYSRFRKAPSHPRNRCTVRASLRRVYGASSSCREAPVARARRWARAPTRCHAASARPEDPGKPPRAYPLAVCQRARAAHLDVGSRRPRRRCSRPRGRVPLRPIFGRGPWRLAPWADPARGAGIRRHTGWKRNPLPLAVWRTSVLFW